MIQFELPQNNANIIKVIGVGGGGGNAVNYMYNLGLEGVDFIVCNTDRKALNSSPVPTKIQLGPSLTQGLGAGANPEIGQKACQESINEIENILVDNTKMVFVTAGMGGGTGTGGAPIVAKAAKDLGILTVGIVTTPFSYEGKRRQRHAEEGIQALRSCVDTILVISNDKLRHQFGNIAASQAFCRADDILATATKCITDVINSQGHIVVDFADVSTVMRDGGVAILGNATAKGENRAYEAAEQALNSPLLNDSNISGAKWVLLNINSAHGEFEHTLDEVEMIQAFIQEQAGEDCDVIFGTGFDDNLGEHISVTIIATGFTFHNTQNAYTKETKRPREERIRETREVWTLGEPVEETPVVNTVVTPEPAPQSVQAPADALAPTMVEIEPPAIPNFMALGLGLASARQAAPAPVQETSQTEQFIKEVYTLEPQDVQPFVVPVAETPQEEVVPVQTQAEPQPVMITEEKIIFELSTEVEPVDEVTPPAIEPVSTATSTAADVQAELDALFSQPPAQMQQIEKTEQEMRDDYVTIKGITLNRRKGSRYMTEAELEAEVNFELQKRAFDERASRLRSMSFNVNRADIDNDELNVPAYQRQNKTLEEHPASGDDVYSDIRVRQNMQNGSNISTLNSFLNGKNPD